MMDLLSSKKSVLSILGLVAIVVLVLMKTEPETLKWVGGFITTILASFNVGQGIADAGSNGKTSSLTP